MQNLHNGPSDDFVEHAHSRIKKMSQAAGELAEELGLPPETKYDLLSTMYDSTVPLYASILTGKKALDDKDWSHDESTHAQDTSPPALLTALPQDEQNDIVLKLDSKQQRGKRTNALLISMAIILMAVGAIVWVLTISDTIKGPWSSICAALLTSVGTIITLSQLYFQLATAPTPALTTLPLSPDAPPSDFNEDFSLPRPSGKKGALVVYTKRSLRGFSVDLHRGYRDGTNTYNAQNIVERKIGGRICYIAVFPSLAPGRYTAHIYKSELVSRINIDSDQVTVIDWR